jgi:pyridinium-3,5-biscarboxylic acid mononucleotide synthase
MTDQATGPAGVQTTPNALPELRVDHDRAARTGLAEAVYGPGKTPEQCAEAVADLLAGPGAGPVLLTRADPDQAAAAAGRNPGAVVASYDEGQAVRTLVWRRQPPRSGSVLVLTAGTSDLPVAREAAAVLEAYGVATSLVADVGVAGLHRVLGQQEALAAADVVVVVAGMEGALASVVGGLTRAPVVAVPTSTGYGASLEGVTALLSMLATCSPGVAVVGIDNGFGAGCVAVRVLNAREAS